MNKIFSNKKVRYIIVSIVSVLLLAIIGFFGYNVYDEAVNALSGGEVIKENDLYVLRPNATKYQKELYRELSKKINSDSSMENDVDIALLVSKSFVADFFTWTNKTGSYDVGGLEYVQSERLKNIMDRARYEFYNYLTDYILKYGSENLLEVTNIEGTSIHGGKYSFNGVEYEDTYYVELNWEYKESDVFDSSKYQKKAQINLIKTPEGRIEIVNFY